jgi:hypothetical protein
MAASEVPAGGLPTGPTGLPPEDGIFGRSGVMQRIRHMVEKIHLE